MPTVISDQRSVRLRTVDGFNALGIPAPPAQLPMPFPTGQLPRLRPRGHVEARAAILNIVQARVFDMPEELAMRWLLDAHVLDHLTPDEWGFIACGRGERARYADQLESLYTVSWLLGLVDHLDPAVPCSEELPELLPDLRRPESFGAWRDRQLTPTRAILRSSPRCSTSTTASTGSATRPAASGQTPPRGVDDNLVWHRRWALEWAVVFAEERPVHWDEVRL